MKKMSQRLPQPVCLHGWRVGRLWRVCCRNCLRPGPSLTYSASPPEFKSFIVVTIFMALWLFLNSNIDILCVMLWIWLRTLIFVSRGFQQGRDQDAHANIIRQICEMFSALPLTFCAVPPITHSRQAQAAADLGNGLPPSPPNTPIIFLMVGIGLLADCAAELLWFGKFWIETSKTSFFKPILLNL